MDGSPREAEAKPQPEITFKFQKNWHFRMDTSYCHQGKFGTILV
jgi:hypothetical protein